MKKKRFMQFLNEELRYKTLEQKVSDIKKIKNGAWLDEYLSNLTKNYTLCNNCQKFSLSKKFKVSTEEVVEHGVCVYQDCGYGDDEYADVLYSITYRSCSICKHKTEIMRRRIKVLNRHGR